MSQVVEEGRGYSASCWEVVAAGKCLDIFVIHAHQFPSRPPPSSTLASTSVPSVSGHSLGVLVSS